jgi:selT/selW/selH-like putative selenoprotein
LAAEIRERFPDAQVELVPSRGGRFEVSRDGAPVYEKSKTGRHAKPGEVVALLSESPPAGSPG